MLQHKHVRQAEPSDCYLIAADMRSEDIEEARAGGLTPLAALQEGLKGSEVCLTLLGHLGQPIAILGVSEGHFKKWGAIWLLGTRSIETCSIAFLRHSKPVLEYLFKHTGYEALYNYTFYQNELHHKWLKWLGFVFLRKVELPPHNLAFYEFVKLRANDV